MGAGVESIDPLRTSETRTSALATCSRYHGYTRQVFLTTHFYVLPTSVQGITTDLFFDNDLFQTST